MSQAEKTQQSVNASIQRLQRHHGAREPDDNVPEHCPLEEVFERAMESLEWRSCPLCHRSSLSMKDKPCGRQCQRFSAANNMDPGPVPPELADLTYLEQQLIARIHPVISVYRIRGQQIGYSGHIINFPQAVKEFAVNLPHRVVDLTSIIAVRVNQPDSQYVDFHVRPAKVKTALEWLKENNQWYGDITVSEENLSLLPADGNLYHQVQHIAEDPQPIEEETSPQV